MAYKVEDVQCSFIFDSLQLSIDGDECTSPAHTSTAMDYHRTMFLAIMKFVNSLLEGKQWCAIFGHMMIWPHSEMKLSHFPHIIFVIS